MAVGSVRGAMGRGPQHSARCPVPGPFTRDGVAWDVTEPSNRVHPRTERLAPSRPAYTVVGSQAFSDRVALHRLAKPPVRPVLHATLGPALRTDVARLARGFA